ncbi:MAG: GtrA family protein [Xanthomonadales bacterium]|nr:GtrA family protein [Xanthomonadales bacterium]
MSHRLGSQLWRFGLVGGIQLLADWACFVALSALGADVVLANLIGRVSGASLGYWLNGRYTFARQGAPQLGKRQLLRFLLFWLLMSGLSTLAVDLLDQAHGLYWAWLGKPLIDATLAAIGFVAARWWIYR